MFIDTHCHLTDPKFYGKVKETVDNYLNNGVSKVIDIGCCVESSLLAKTQAEEFESVYFSAGVHPSDANAFNNDATDKIIELAMHKKCVAIGEIGLDYYWQPYDKEKQIECFIKQLEIANFVKLPVSIHVRDAMGDAVRILKENENKLRYGGVMHCYAGSKESATELMKMGLYIAFGGTLTFKNARNIPEVASFIPIDRILTETDSPFLAPEGKRGTVNEPQNIPIIASRLAELKNAELPVFAEQVMKNAKTLFTKIN